MKWIDGLCELTSRFGQISDWKRIRQSGRVYLEDTQPAVCVFRLPKRVHGLPASTSDSYLLEGVLQGISRDVIYADDEFYTIAQSHLRFSQPTSLRMCPKSVALALLFTGKRPARWRVTGNCAPELAEKISEIIKEVDPERPDFYEVMLVPSDDGVLHGLLVRTAELPDDLGQFGIASNYTSRDEAGRPIPRTQLAIRCMERLVEIDRRVHALLSEAVE